MFFPAILHARNKDLLSFYFIYLTANQSISHIYSDTIMVRKKTRNRQNDNKNNKNKIIIHCHIN